MVLRRPIECSRIFGKVPDFGLFCGPDGNAALMANCGSQKA